MGNVFTDNVRSILVRKFNFKLLRQTGGFHINDFHRDSTARQLLSEQSRLFEGVNLSIGINTPLKTERSICIQAVATSAFANPCGVEISAFKEHIGGRFIGAAALSAKHPGNAHGFFSIADGQITVGESMFFTIEGDKLRTFGHRLHHHFIAFHHVGIKAVEGLSVGHHHVVGDVHNVVDRAQTDGRQFVLQPFRALLHFTTTYRNGTIAWAGFRIFHHHFDGKVVVVYAECLVGGTMQSRGKVIAQKVSVQIACNAPMRASIGAVGGDVYFNEEIAFQTKVFSSGSTHLRFSRQHHDAVVVCPHADFIFGTNHTVTFDTTQL